MIDPTGHSVHLELGEPDLEPETKAEAIPFVSLSRVLEAAKQIDPSLEYSVDYTKGIRPYGLPAKDQFFLAVWEKDRPEAGPSGNHRDIIKSFLSEKSWEDILQRLEAWLLHETTETTYDKISKTPR